MTDKKEIRFTKKSLTKKNTTTSTPATASAMRQGPTEVAAVPRLYGGKENKVKSDRKIDKELLAIYENEDGTMPNMKNFVKRKNNGVLKALLIFIFACLFLGSVAWAGFFVFQPTSKFNESDIILSVSGDDKIIDGQEVNYRINYRNGESVAINNASVQIRYPEGFIFTSSSRSLASNKNDEWNIGTISAHQSGYIDLKGKLFGDLNEKKSFRIFFNYSPANFSSEFQKVSSQTVEINQSPIELSLQSPTEVFNGGRANFSISLHTKNNQKFDNLVLEIEPGIFFSKVSSTPLSDNKNDFHWSLASTSADFLLNIQTAVNNSDSQIAQAVFGVKVLAWPDQNRNSKGYVVAESTSTIKLIKADIKDILAINGAVVDANVAPGMPLNLSINLKNDGDQAIKNIVAKLFVEAPASSGKSILDWSKLDDKSNGDVKGEQINAETRRGIIIWGSKQIPALGQINGNDQLTVDVNLPIKDQATIDLRKFNTNKIVVWSEIQYEQGGETKNLVSNQINLTINSDLDLAVKDKVSKNDQGQETHKIAWILGNNFHELKNITVGAEFYGDLTWNENDLLAPVGKVEFNNDNKQLIWRIADLNNTNDVSALQFSITLNKRNSNQTDLTSKVKVKATDAITGQEIIKVVDGILLN